MNKIVIYGRGKLLENYKRDIKWEYVVAIADKTAGQDEMYNNIPVIHPEFIEDYTYDFIAIFSNIYFDEICMELEMLYSVPLYKVISWRPIIGEKINKNDYVDFVYNYIKANGIISVLDSDISYFPQFFLTKDSLETPIIRLDGIGKIKYPIINNLYDHIYNRIDQVEIKQYGLVILWNILEDEKKLMEALQLAEICLLIIDHLYGMNLDINKLVSRIEGNAVVKLFHNQFGWILEIRKKKLKKSYDVHIYVVTHKKYNVKSDDLYKPICVGTYKDYQYLSDEIGDNISHLNEKINEITALYWMWKNSNEYIVGLNHYRRYFYNNGMQVYGNYLQKETIIDILERHDIILAKMRRTDSVLREIKSSVGNNYIFQKGYNLIETGLKKKYPDYLDAFDQVINGQVEYICNMFVTKRNVFDSYCEWLFSFLIEATENMDVSGYYGNTKRVMGYFAERLLTVWLLRQDIRIKELPIMNLF